MGCASTDLDEPDLSRVLLVSISTHPASVTNMRRMQNAAEGTAGPEVNENPGGGMKRKPYG